MADNIRRFSQLENTAQQLLQTVGPVEMAMETQMLLPEGWISSIQHVLYLHCASAKLDYMPHSQFLITSLFLECWSYFCQSRCSSWSRRDSKVFITEHKYS